MEIYVPWVAGSKLRINLSFGFTPRVIRSLTCGYWRVTYLPYNLRLLPTEFTGVRTKIRLTIHSQVSPSQLSVYLGQVDLGQALFCKLQV